MRSDKGIALVMTLWVLVLLSVVAMNFSFSARYGNASTRNFREETEAHYAAVSAYEEAVSYLLSDMDPAVDFIDGDGVYWTDTARTSPVGRRTYGNTEVDLVISDEESRLNINSLGDATLKRLFSYAGAPDDETDGLVDALMDWRDADDLHHLSGAESDYYESLEPGYKAKNGNLETPEELTLIKGFKPEYLFGGGEGAPLYPLVTTYGAALNINSASPELLSFLGLAEPDIEAIMDSRTAEAGGIKAVSPGHIATEVQLSTASSNIRIEVSASMPGGKNVLKITSVLRKVAGQKGLEFKTLYWREGIEAGGA